MQYVVFKNREIDFDKPVDVYRCLNRSGNTYSIRQSGKVVAHTTQVTIEDAKFIINESGKKRCIKEQQRNVHAFIRGKITEKSNDNVLDHRISYNPFEDKGFMCNGYVLRTAPVVNVNVNGVTCNIF